MDKSEKSPKGSRTALPAGVSAAALLAFSAGAAAQMSEIDAFQRAVSTQRADDALAFIDGFTSSHLVPDLIDLLPPHVARDVCARLPSGSSRAGTACDAVMVDIAAVPTATDVPQAAVLPGPPAAAAPETTAPPEDESAGGLVLPALLLEPAAGPATPVDSQATTIAAAGGGNGGDDAGSAGSLGVSIVREGDGDDGGASNGGSSGSGTDSSGGDVVGGGPSGASGDGDGGEGGEGGKGGKGGKH